MRRGQHFNRGKHRRATRILRGKTRITIRLDADILQWFREQAQRAGGGNYHTLINDALRQHMRRAQEPLEATLRRVLRDELRHTI